MGDTRRDRQQDSSSGKVPVRLPPWLAGNNILGYMNDAGLKAWGVNAASFEWTLQTLETYEHRRPRLITVDTIAGRSQPERWEILKTLHEPVTHAYSRNQILAERDRVLQERPHDLAALFSAVKIMVSLVSPNDVAAEARNAYETLLSLPGGDIANPVLPQLTVKFIRVAPSLMKRIGLARVLMRVQEEPNLLKNKPTPAPGKTAFGSGWHLSSDLALTKDAYLAPLYLAASPWVWCIPCPRIGGIIVYDLGLTIIGRRGEASELLQLFFPTGTLGGGTRPPVTALHTGAATDWWVTQMDAMLSALSDFANYTGGEGEFVPRRLFETFMSVEQLGRRLQGVLAHDRDNATRRALSFDAFDTLKGLGVVDLFEAGRLSRSERVLRSLESDLPASVAELLLIPARKAVDALRHLQSGFFLPSRTTGAVVRLPDRHGADRDWPIEDAVALYIQLLRNANHGFTPERDADERRDQILLMAHDGDIPGDLALLPYLYWLDTLAHPERLARAVRPRAR